eukprot:m.201137 g.201137  ORF g.201137 m.201137 type:complete len:662 (-) comp21931_c0_seq2:27-2012(-)
MLALNQGSQRQTNSKRKAMGALQYGVQNQRLCSVAPLRWHSGKYVQALHVTLKGILDVVRLAVALKSQCCELCFHPVRHGAFISASGPKCVGSLCVQAGEGEGGLRWHERVLRHKVCLPQLRQRQCQQAGQGAAGQQQAKPHPVPREKGQKPPLPCPVRQQTHRAEADARCPCTPHKQSHPTQTMADSGLSRISSKAASSNKEYFMKMKGMGGAPAAAKPATAAAPAAKKDDPASDKEKEKADKLAKLAEEKAKLEAKLKAESEKKKTDEEAAAKKKQDAEEEEKKKKKQQQEEEEQREKQNQAAAAEEKAKKSAASTPAAKSDPEEDKKPIRCKALMAFVGNDEDGELTFAEGDIIYLPPGSDLGARVLRGVCKGKSGMFLANCVENTATGQRCGPKTGVRCRAVGNYTAKAPGELSFKQGDSVFVIKKTNQPMWSGVFQGKTGLFPRTMVVDEEDEKELKKAASNKEIKIKRCRAIKSFTGNDSSQLSFTYGDIILVPKPNSSEVWQGVCKGNVGMFPASFVVDADEYTKEQIDQMIEVEKKVAESAADDPFGSDPFAPKATSAAPANDPFAEDPFSKSAAVVTADPFAPQPTTSSASSSVTSSPPKGYLPPVLGSVVAAALSPKSQRRQQEQGQGVNLDAAIRDVQNVIGEVDQALNQ